VSSSPTLCAGAMILAAGAATRMGELKQLLSFAGKTLVERAVDLALEAGFAPVVLVVGAEAQTVERAINGKPVQIVKNDNWETGMGSSIRCGMAAIKEIRPDLPAVAILLADQPLVTAENLKSMREQLEQNTCSVVAAEYSGTVGVPAIFRREVFGRLAAVAPDAGAKKLLKELGTGVLTVPLPEAAADVDTPEDFAALARFRS
jgi:molybdenum cofactor cytidylyltransferase